MLLDVQQSRERSAARTANEILILSVLLQFVIAKLHVPLVFPLAAAAREETRLNVDSPRVVIQIPVSIEGHGAEAAGVLALGRVTFLVAGSMSPAGEPLAAMSASVLAEVANFQSSNFVF